jgi:uncharacterized protein (DUF433 family)
MKMDGSEAVGIVRRRFITVRPEFFGGRMVFMRHLIHVRKSVNEELM